MCGSNAGRPSVNNFYRCRDGLIQRQNMCSRERTCQVKYILPFSSLNFMSFVEFGANLAPV